MKGNDSMEEIVKKASISKAVIIVVIFCDILAMFILVGFIWIIKDLIKFGCTKLEITNRSVNGKTGLTYTKELNSPLNQIQSIRIEQRLLGKIFNYSTITISTGATSFNFKHISKPKDFKRTLNHQIERYEDELIEKQARAFSSIIR